jgi:hypothetical protein
VEGFGPLVESKQASLGENLVVFGDFFFVRRIGLVTSGTTTQ